MEFLVDYVVRCKTLVFPLIAVIILAIVLLATGRPSAAWWVGNFGTALVMLGNGIYIVAFHSRSRWPDKNAGGRLVNLFTFQR